MTDFNLRSLVRTVISGGGLVGPRDIASKVAEGVPEADLRTALVEALVAYVREELTRERRPLAGPPSLTGVANASRSAKVAAIREGWRRTLSGQFHVGSGQWQVLADCNYQQVAFLADERREMARRNAAAAAMFAGLAEAMLARGADRVGDLPDSLLADILGAEEPT